MTSAPRTALIVAHGQPSAPDGPEAEMAALARQVAGHLPGWQVASATLAHPTALQRAVTGTAGLTVFPFFMADGWFIRTALPRRLAEAGADAPQILPPFGLHEATQTLIAEVIDAAMAEAGWHPAQTALLLAAHGSGRSPYPAEAAQRTRDGLAAHAPFAALRTGFIEQAPYLAEAAQGLPDRALCLPLFVARWGHVVTDIPEALDEAGFAGRLLAPIGTHETVPALIAAALAGAAEGRRTGLGAGTDGPNKRHL